MTSQNRERIVVRQLPAPGGMFEVWCDPNTPPGDMAFACFIVDSGVMVFRVLAAMGLMAVGIPCLVALHAQDAWAAFKTMIRVTWTTPMALARYWKSGDMSPDSSYQPLWAIHPAIIAWMWINTPDRDHPYI